MNLIDLNDIINKSKNILIVTHVNPDGDALGSMTAMYGILQDNFKKNPSMLALSHIPSIYQYLPHIKEIKTLDDIDKSMVYDLVIAVDLAALDRLMDAQILFDKAKFTINLDHHKTNNGYGDFARVKGNASSAGEVIYEVAKELNWKISEEVALSLYTSILTDTGAFKFDNTSAKSLRVAADLIERGVKPVEVYKKCYENKSKGLVLFQNYCMNKAQFINDDKIAYLIVYKKDLDKFNAKGDYTDGLAETLRSINTTEVSFVLKEIGDKVFKASMRSKHIDIAKVCETFNGGGHKFAAGCTIKASAEDAVKRIVNQIHKQEF